MHITNGYFGNYIFSFFNYEVLLIYLLDFTAPNFAIMYIKADEEKLVK